MRPRVLVADDKENIVALVRAVLQGTCEVTSSQDGQHALALALAGDFDVVVTDIRMPGLDGFALLQELRQAKPDVEVVLMTAFGSVPKAVEAMRAGAFDYLTKPFDPDEALLTIERAAERKRLRVEARDLRAALAAPYRLDRLVGKSTAMRQVFELIRRAAACDVPVLIVGETGTGKELVARAIHASGATKDDPLVVVNCPGMDEEALAEAGPSPDPKSRGARDGCFAPGQPGTALLDEVGELSPSRQARLVRALQERSSGSDEEGVEVEGTDAPRGPRVVATSRLDLKAAVQAGRFRDDLYYRLNVLRVQLPPLRERKDDIPLLVAHFLERYGRKYSDRIEGFTPEGLAALMRYDWPGNVRELENAVEHALAVVDGPRVPLEALPDEIRAYGGRGVIAGLENLTYTEAVDLARDRASREYLIAVMREFKGNVARAAERAGVERESLHRLLKRYGLRSSEFKRSEG
jgi:DNA-binding NtrC family response regulator